MVFVCSPCRVEQCFASVSVSGASGKGFHRKGSVADVGQKLALV